MNLVLQVAAASQMPVPLASLVRDRLQRLVASGRAELDWAAMAQDAAEDAGLRPRPA